MQPDDSDQDRAEVGGERQAKPGRANCMQAPHLTQLHDDEEAAVPTVEEALKVVDYVRVFQCSEQVHLVAGLHRTETS